VCLCVCSSSPFLDPWGAGTGDLDVFRTFKFFSPLAEVGNSFFF